MKSKRNKAARNPVEERPKQQTPAEVVQFLMNFVRTSFYQDFQERWFPQQREVQKVVTWPAAWLNSRGVTLPPERYKAILVEMVTTIKHHGETGSVKYWPRYLLHCFQEHFKHHGEDYYDEGKAIRTRLEGIVGLLQRSTEARRPDTVEALAQVHKALQTGKRKPKPITTPTKAQLNLF
jgi:hypothetical protein